MDLNKLYDRLDKSTANEYSEDNSNTENPVSIVEEFKLQTKEEIIDLLKKNEDIVLEYEILKIKMEELLGKSKSINQKIDKLRMFFAKPDSEIIRDYEERFI